MIINLLWGLPLTIALIGILLIIRRQPEGSEWNYRNTGITFIVIGFLVFLIIGGIFGGIYMSKMGKIAEMEAFYRANAENYGTAVSNTSAILSTESYTESQIVLIEGSIEKIYVGEEVARRIREWREDVNRYNSDLSVYQRFDRNPIIGCLWPDCPDDLGLLQIGE